MRFKLTQLIALDISLKKTSMNICTSLSRQKVTTEFKIEKLCFQNLDKGQFLSCSNFEVKFFKL